MNLISCLPNEIHFKIQTYFDRNSALNYSCTSHACQELLFLNNLAWKTIFPKISFPTQLNAKSYLDSHAVSTLDEVQDLILQFSQKLALRQKGIFTCLFPFNKNLTLHIKLRFDSKIKGFALINGSMDLSVLKPSKTPPLNETSIYMKKISIRDMIKKKSLNKKNIYHYQIKENLPYIFSSENSVKKMNNLIFFEEFVNQIAQAELAIKAEKFYKRAAKLEYIKLAAFVGTFALTCLFINLSIK